MMTYLFEFKFEKNSINEHLIDWCKEREIDYFHGHLGGIYADVFGEGKHFKLETEAVGNGVFEVYVNKDIIEFASLSRLYPMVPKAIKIEMPIRTLRLYFKEGNPITTVTNFPSKEAIPWFEGSLFNTPSGVQTCVKADVVA